jgi:hypothetical protein
MSEMEISAARYVRVATVGDLVEARVLAARLGAEGIDVRVHSESLGPYPVTVGGLAEAELWVLSDRVDEANQILLDADVNSVLASVGHKRAPHEPLPFGIRAIAIAVGLVIVMLWIVRFARVI